MPDPAKMEAAVHEYVAAFDAGSAERAAALFAQGASVEDPAGSPPHVGRDAILAFYSFVMKTGARLRLDGPVRMTADTAAFAFSVVLHMDGKDMQVDVIDLFRFNEANEITEMRAYFGPTNMHALIERN